MRAPLIPNTIGQLHKSEYLGTSSVYFLAKEDRTFPDHFDLLQQQD